MREYRLNARAPSYARDLKERLRDSSYAGEFLAAALREDDRPAFVLALRKAVEAHGVSKVARRSGLNRETLYRTLSSKGNPTLRSLAAVLDALGVRLSVEPKHAHPPGGDAVPCGPMEADAGGGVIQSG